MLGPGLPDYHMLVCSEVRSRFDWNNSPLRFSLKLSLDSRVYDMQERSSNEVAQQLGQNCRCSFNSFDQVAAINLEHAASLLSNYPIWLSACRNAAYRIFQPRHPLLHLSFNTSTPQKWQIQDRDRALQYVKDQQDQEVAHLDEDHTTTETTIATEIVGTDEAVEGASNGRTRDETTTSGMRRD